MNIGANAIVVTELNLFAFDTMEWGALLNIYVRRVIRL